MAEAQGLRAEFVFKKHRTTVEVTSSTLTVTVQHRKRTDRLELSAREVVTLRRAAAGQDGAGKGSGEKGRGGEKGGAAGDLLTLYYVRKRYNFKWKMESVSWSAGAEEAAAWQTAVDELLKDEREKRPRRLLVMVNPCSGNLKGEKIYRTQAQPVFEAAGIQCDVTVTTDGEHPQRIVDECDISLYQGVVCVGGDGTFNLVVNALLRRQMRDHGKDIHTEDPEKLALPVGGMPGGTGNAISKKATGTYSTETYALYIALGVTDTEVAMQVKVAGRHERLCDLFTGYGVMAQSFQFGEEKRASWGGARGLYGVVKSFKRNESHEMEVSWLPKDTDEWEHRDGRFASLDIFIMPMAFDGPLDYWTEGLGSAFSLFVARPSSRWQLIKQTKKMVNLSGGDRRSPHVEMVHARELRYKILLPAMAEDRLDEWMHIDGDVVRLHGDEVQVRLVGEVISIYGGFNRLQELNPQATIGLMDVHPMNKWFKDSGK